MAVVSLGARHGEPGALDVAAGGAAPQIWVVASVGGSELLCVADRARRLT